MIKIEVMHHAKHWKTFSYAHPVTIQKLVDDNSTPDGRIITFRINNEYFGSNHLIETDTKMEMINYTDSDGHRMYQDGSIFLMMKAIHNVLPAHIQTIVEHSIGDGVYCEVFGKEFELSPDHIEAIKNEMIRLVQAELPIEKISLTHLEAEQLFMQQGRLDIVRDIHDLNKKSYVFFKCEDYYDYYIRQLAYNTKVLNVFDLVYIKPGFILRFPDPKKCEIKNVFVFPRKLFAAHQEHDKWLHILRVHTLHDLNKYNEQYKISEFIQIEEALHEKKIAYMADQIAQKSNAKIVLIAGPSSSGKTTFAKRLAVQLRVNGLMPLVIGMDDYFLPRTETPRKPDGDFDFESIYAMDLPLLNEQLLGLLEGKEVELPKYNFVLGDREFGHHKLKMKKDNIIVMEGIHAINDKLTASIPSSQKIKIYISALNQLNIDNHNRIPTTDSRKIRRIVRDNNYRGYTAEETIMRWESVREGEDKNIFPYQENADYMFNSSLTYELGILKKYVMPLLSSISKHSSVYLEAQRLISILDHIHDIQDDLIPYNSILREFTKGSIFKY